MKKTLSTPTRTRVLVVDDHPLYREGLIQLINRQSDLTCCGEAASVAAAQEAALRLKPGLMLLDLRMGSGDSLELIKFLKARLPDLKILVLSQMDETVYAERVMRAGASGFLAKEEATEEVRTAIRTVLGGELYVSRRMGVLLLHKFVEGRSGAGRSGVESLTNREIQVFQLLGAGVGTSRIAHELGVSAKTIDTHRENIKHKLGFRDASELVQQATVWVQGAGPPAPSVQQFRPGGHAQPKSGLRTPPPG